MTRGSRSVHSTRHRGPSPNSHNAKEQMKMRSKRTALGIAALGVAASLALVGCTNGGEPETDGEVTITWWGWNAVDPEATIAAFEEANPGINVEFTAY